MADQRGDYGAMEGFTYLTTIQSTAAKRIDVYTCDTCGSAVMEWQEATIKTHHRDLHRGHHGSAEPGD